MLRLSALVTLVAVAFAVVVGGAPGGRTSHQTSAQASFPVTIVASNGKVTVTRKPRRIVSLSPTATESLFAIGADSQVVAVDDQSDHPKRAPKTSLSGFTPNVEAIARTGRIWS